MKYESNLIYRNHWGGGETQVYEVEDYRAVFCLFTGSCFRFYRKEDLNVDSIESGFFPFAQSGKTLDNRWDLFREGMDDCIDRCLDKAKNPETHIEWYEKVTHPDDGKWYLNNEKLCFSSDDSEENKLKIKSNPLFVSWYQDYWKKVEEDNKRNYEEWNKAKKS